MELLTNFATESAANQGLLQALGIDWKLLVEQAIAFLILVGVLGKFVYPTLVKAIDSRREAIEASLEEAKKVQEESASAEDKIEKLLVEARKEADEIVKRSHQEATTIVADAEAKAKTRAESFLKDAHAQLEADVTKARAVLKRDTISLVANATEQLLHEKVDAKKDEALIKRVLEKEAA
jgi:F-type H+-transporting ATPase subunit b